MHTQNLTFTYVDDDTKHQFFHKLTVHKNEVKQCWNILKSSLKDYDPNMEIYIELHDMSKYQEPELSAYAMKYVYSKMTSEERKQYKYFSYIHKISNRHHPEYWIHRTKDLLQMDDSALLEMACDIMSFKISRNPQENPLEYFRRRLLPQYKFSQEQIKILENAMEIIDVSL